MNGTIIQKFSAFLKLQKLQGNMFSFPKKMFYKIHSLGSYERILLKAFQFVSIVYFTETEISSRKHQAGTMFVIRLKMTAAYQQLELDLNFSITSCKNHTSLTELLTPSAFQKQYKHGPVKMWKSKNGGRESEKLFFVVERAILPFFLIKYARFTGQESMSQDLNNLLDNESGSQQNLHDYGTTQ